VVPVSNHGVEHFSESGIFEWVKSVFVMVFSGLDPSWIVYSVSLPLEKSDHKIILLLIHLFVAESLMCAVPRHGPNI